MFDYFHANTEKNLVVRSGNVEADRVDTLL